MYRIVKDKMDELERVRIVNSENGEYLSVIPAYGANLNELVMQKNKEMVALIDGNHSAALFNGPGIFNSAKLLPFPNRVADGRFELAGKWYQLAVNFQAEHNACHGFIYDRHFQIDRITAEKNYGEVRFTCSYRKEAMGFPFDFDVAMTYRLEPRKGMTCLTTVENRGLSAMPIGDGWHPFFSFNKDIGLIHLRFSAEEIICVDDRLIPTGESKDYDLFNAFRAIGNTEFDSCFRVQDDRGKHVAALYDPQTKTGINLWQETGQGKYNYLQIYIPPDRTRIALEPMSCNVNAFNNKQGLLVLEPGEKFEAAYGLCLVN